MSESRLSLWQKLAYAAGSPAQSWMGNAMGWLVMPIFSVAMGVDPWLIGIGMGLPLVYDALIDPYIGNRSDSFHSRFGRRRPFMATGAVLGGLLFALLWLPTQFGWGSNAVFAWLLVFRVMFQTCFSLFVVPYGALALEIATNAEERASLLAWKGVISQITGLSGAWMTVACFWDWGAIFRDGTLVERLSAMTTRRTTHNAELDGVLIVGAFVGGTIALSGVLACLTRENPTVRVPEHISYGKALKHAAGNRTFMTLNAAILTAFFGVFLVSPMAYFVNVFYVFGGDRSAAALLGAQASTVLAVLGLTFLAPLRYVIVRFGPLRTFRLFLLVTAVGVLAKFWTYTPLHPWLQLVSLSLWQFSWTGVMMTYQVLLGDVCDADDLDTGQRREGVFGAASSLLVQLSIAGSTALSGLLLSFCGVVAGDATQSDAAILRLRVTFAVIPAVLMGVSTLILIGYTLTDERANAVRLRLRERREAALLPNAQDRKSLGTKVESQEDASILK